MNVPSDVQVATSRDQPTPLDACAVRVVDAVKVAEVTAAIPTTEDLEGLVDVFALLGDHGRLKLLVALLEGGELCVCDLAATTSMSESAVSHALRLLRAHRAVAVSRRGRMAYYRLVDRHVSMLLDVGLAHISQAASTQCVPTGKGGR
ncbi:MAG: ArsR/SmtB family transcription factor [Acidimicrobiales bacterium]